MYLLSKFIKPKFIIPLLIIVIFTVYFISATLFRNAFVYFCDNLSVSKNKFTQEINCLKAKNVELILKEDKFRDLVKYNNKLKKLLGFQKEHNIKVVPLNVISMVPSRFKKAIIVEGGRNRGIKDGTLIMDGNGFLMGKVSRAYEDYSEIILVNDPDFYITVKIKNSMGLLKGTLGGALKVFYVDNKAEIKSNDEVLALSYHTHSALAVGKVRNALKERNDFFMDITVEPYSKLYPYKTVFAVK